MTTPDGIYVEVVGVARGNPGFAGIGIVIRSKREPGASPRPVQISHYLGLATSIQADYLGFVEALKQAQERHPASITVAVANETVWRQLEGQSRATSPDIIPLLERANAMRFSGPHVEVVLEPPDNLAMAETLANLAIDTRGRRLAIDL